MNSLRSHSLSRRPCSLGSRPSHSFSRLSWSTQIFECTDLKFTVCGWSKQTSIHMHTCAQCSHASVWLAQARPNKWKMYDAFMCIWTLRTHLHNCAVGPEKTCMLPLPFPSLWSPFVRIEHLPTTFVIHLHVWWRWLNGRWLNGKDKTLLASTMAVPLQTRHHARSPHLLLKAWFQLQWRTSQTNQGMLSWHP